MQNSPQPALRISQMPQKLRDIALDRVRSAIISGYFKAGERLVERHLCEELGVSRSVVREVIRILETEGFIESTARGPEVSRLDRQTAQQIYDIRRLLEGHASAEAARLADEGMRAAILAAAEELAHLVETEGGAAAYEATNRFYAMIFAAAGHPLAWGVVERLSGRVSRLRAMTLQYSQRAVSGPDRMRAIARAIASGDSLAAQRAVEEHLTDAARIADTLLSNEATT